MPDKHHGTDIVLISLQVDLDTIGLKTLHYTLLRQSFNSLLLYLPGVFSDEGQHSASLRVFEQVRDFIAKVRPRLVGISLMSHEFSAAVAVTGYLKDEFRDLVVIWGGIHPTIAPAMCLEHADYLCIGEGERALPEFVRTVQKNKPVNISNIWFKDAEGRIIENGLASPIQNPDEIVIYDHIPRHSFVFHKKNILPLDRRLFKKYGRWRGTVYSIMGSRGCPFSCTYCCNNFLSKLYDRKTIRRRSVSSLIAEIKQAVRDNPDLCFINFQDDCFLACSDAYLEEFCRAYKEHISTPFIVRCIPTSLTEKRLALLKDAGVAWVSMGLQSGSDRVLEDIYQRRALRDDFVRAARVINKLKVAAYYDVIFDNPLEAENDRLETLLTVASLPRPYFLQIFSLVAYPGTAIYDEIIKVRPEKAEEYLTKNYHAYTHDSLNKMIRSAAYLPPAIMARLTRIYRVNRAGLKFRAGLAVSAKLSASFFEPLTYFRVFRMSHNGSLGKMMQMLPAFFRIGLSRYIKQYSAGYMTVAERIVRDNISHGSPREQDVDSKTAAMKK